MKLKIDAVEYKVTPIPPYLSPYSTRISELLTRKPQTNQEADEISNEIIFAMKKLLSGTVTPAPLPEHELRLFKAVIQLTNTILEDAGLFRQPKKSNIEKSRAVSATTPSAPQQNSKA